MKYFFLIIALLVFLNESEIHSQSTWYKIYGGDRTDQNFSIINTKDHNILATGFINVYNPSMNLYIRQTVLTKFDLNGNIMWQRLIGDTVFLNYAFSSVQGKDGNIYVPVSGQIQSLYKISNDGDIIWSKQYSDTLIRQWLAIQFNSDSNKIIISGYNPAEFAYKINLTQLDTSGNILNHKVIASEDSLNSYSGGYFVVKDNFIYLVYGQGTGSSLVCFIGKFDPGFNLIWKINIPLSYGVNSITSISETSFMGLGFHWNPFYMYINKFDINGNLMWGKDYNNLYHDNSIYKTLNNNIAVVGRANYDTAKFTLLDTLGNIKMVVKHPSHLNDYFDYFDIKQTIDSSFVIAGLYHRYNSNYPDCIVLKTDKNGNTVPLSVNINNTEVNNFKIKIYPNPFNSASTIELISDIKTNLNLSIYNLIGEKIFNSKIYLSSNNRELIKINFEQLVKNSGCYFLQLSNNKINIVKKLIYIK